VQCERRQACSVEEHKPFSSSAHSEGVACCVVDSNLHCGSNALFQQLHRLLIQYLIKFIIAKFAFLARASTSSSYRNSSVAQYLPSHSLRSQNACLLALPRCKAVYGSHMFRIATPTFFSLFPQDIRCCDSILTFCCLLKIFILVSHALPKTC